MSDTPETDEARKDRVRGGWEGIPLGFAQQLERERDAARRMAKELRERLEWATDDPTPDFPWENAEVCDPTKEGS